MKSWQKWSCLILIVVLPALVTMVTTTVSFERAKSVEFCNSCHIMKPFVDDMKNPESENLAAKHFNHRWIQKNQCYTCHTNYNFLGPIDAKWRGLKHIAAFYGKKKKELKLYDPFPNASCLQCHQGAKSFNEDPVHQVVMEQIKSNETSCMECHSSVHPEEKQIK